MYKLYYKLYLHGPHPLEAQGWLQSELLSQASQCSAESPVEAPHLQNVFDIIKMWIIKSNHHKAWTQLNTQKCVLDNFIHTESHKRLVWFTDAIHTEMTGAKKQKELPFFYKRFGIRLE